MLLKPRLSVISTLVFFQSAILTAESFYTSGSIRQNSLLSKQFSQSSVLREAASATGSPCDIPEALPTTVTGSDLRSIRVLNSDGEMVRLGDAIGPQTSVVVFLRHLGCSWCWSYARSWCELQQEMGNENIGGPIFVSIGDQQRLNAFLDKNPNIPRENMFVDGYDFAAYKQAGFGRFDEKPKEATESAIQKPVKLGLEGWWTFLTSFAPLAPVTEDMKFPEMFTPEGLFWVGGTLVVRGNDIAYRWDDRTSGDQPEAAEVLSIAKEVARTSASEQANLGNLFGIF